MFGGLFKSDDKAKDDKAEASDNSADTAARVFGSLLSTVQDISARIKTSVEKAADTALGDFNREHQKFVTSNHKLRSGLPPWADCEDEATVKDQILSLSADKRNFIRDPPPGSRQFYFVYEDYAGVAQAVLAEDARLQRMRFELVPKLINEETFWRNYFYRVSLIKSATVLTESRYEPSDQLGSDLYDPGLSQSPPKGNVGLAAASANAAAASSSSTAAAVPTTTTGSDAAANPSASDSTANAAASTSAPAAASTATATKSKDDPFADGNLSDASFSAEDQYLGNDDGGVNLDDLEQALRQADSESSKPQTSTTAAATTASTAATAGSSATSAVPAQAAAKPLADSTATPKEVDDDLDDFDMLEQDLDLGDLGDVDVDNLEDEIKDILESS
eukprot:m.79193 g.79193  ORF g.79193 m.79193 type:complete len:391 (+) comp14781_c1_seq2:315-1487(+)